MLQLMDDLRSADVDFLTIGQYLQPTRKHHAVFASCTPDEFEGYENDRLRQGLPDGVGEPADALVASCRRGFRRLKAARRSDGRLRLRRCRDFDQPTRAPQRSGPDVRPRRRRRALSGIRAAVPASGGPAAGASARAPMIVRRHDGGLQAGPGDLHAAGSRSTGRTCKSVEYSNGPFRHLENRWSFEAKLRTEWRVGFFIDYEFKSRMLGV